MRAQFDQQARVWLEDRHERRAVAPRAAASVLLLREARRADATGVEVFTQHRVAGMAFAASMYVYPGGGVDERDGQGELEWAGPGRRPEQWVQALGVEEPLARLVVLAAVRELFEESGVLLAGTGADSLAPARGPRWRDYRAGLVSRRLRVAEVMRAESLVPRSDLLHPVARWVTPECEPRRYDTFFFAAALPPGQDADGETSEACAAGWVDPAWLVRDACHALMAPTQILAEELAEAGGLREFLHRGRSMSAVRPYPVDTADGIQLRVPGAD